MNYIRGAYQYYRDLPPINAATLTGAIDVIVIERPAGDDAGPGETVLGCTPFHVRFGKWQILRPGEKQVTVTVNNRPVPFLMKIGDAGEAFFVCETDEDVPDELMTSPILGATRAGAEGRTEKEKVKVEVPEVGRFGAREEGTEMEVEVEIERAVSPEPPFLDLDSTTPPAPSRTPSHSPQPSTSVSAASTSRSTTPPSPPTTTSPSPQPLPERADSGESIARPLRDPRGEGERKVDEATKPSPRDEVRDGEDDVNKGPEVTYMKDVVLDMEGYHAHPDLAPNLPPSNSTASSNGDDDNDDSRAKSLVKRVLGLGKEKIPDEEAGRPSEEEEAEKEHQEDRERDERRRDGARVAMGGRALSEPPGMGGEGERDGGERRERRREERTPVRAGIQHLRGMTFSSTPALPHLTLSSLPGPHPRTPSPPLTQSQPSPTPTLTSAPPQQPDYTWEWGSLPTPRTPQPLEGAREEKEKRLLGVGGKIYPKGKEGWEVGLEVEEGRTGFELSLCGEEGLRGESEIEQAQAFATRRVRYKDFVESPSIVHDPDLVIKWANDKYVTRADASPLFEALVAWRLEAAPYDFVGEQSEQELAAAGAAGKEPQEQGQEQKGQGTQPPSLSKASSWSRWWRGGGGGAGSGGRQEELGMRRGASSPANVGGGERSEVDGQDAEVDKDTTPPPPTVAPSTATGPVLAPGSVEGLPEVGGEGVQQKRPAFAKTLRLTSDQLKLLELKPGANTVTFSLTSSKTVMCTARIFLWRNTDLLVVSDIDGTITKSDALGHVFTMIGRDWTHSGVAKLYTDICRNGYKIMYLTSRAIGQADSTRDYLKGIKQNDYQLPEGPVIMSPDRLMASLHREVIMRKPEVFKMACLRDIQRLFGEGRHPFYAGFGNRITDALSYRSVNIPSGRIFTIDSSGEVKMELLELAGYKSSYIHMTDLVDQMFPPVHRKWAPEFTDLNYWRTPFANVEIPDLRPPSPALSARSDSSSRLSRLRNFTLGLPATTSRQPSSASAPAVVATANGDAKPQPRPTSPLMGPSITAESLEGEREGEEKDFQLSQSPTDSMSMPGSLPGSPDPDSWMRRSDSEDERGDEDEEGTEGRDGGMWEGGHGVGVDEAFDDELLATGEMENVPF